MENKSSDRQGKISLDKIVREIAELESSRGEPDKIWSLSDIDELIASTNAVSPVPADEDDAELLTSIQYYEDAYSDDKASGYEPVREPEPEYEPEETAEPEQGADEPDVDISDKTDDEAPAEPEEANKAPAEAEPADEMPAEEAVPEEAVEAPAEEEPDGAPAKAADEAPAEDGEEIYSDSKFELSVAESDGDTDTDGAERENVVPLNGEDKTPQDGAEEKKPTVEELFGAPAARYFGEPAEETEDDSENEERAVPGLFDDTVVFGPMKTLSEPTRKDGDEYKTKLISAIGSANAPQSSETIEKPGVILKRGPLSETSGLEPLPKVIPAEDFVGSENDTASSIEDRPFTNPAAENRPEEEQMMLSGFGEEPETEKIDEDEPQQEESRPEEKAEEPEEQPKKKKKRSEKAPLEYEKPEQRGRIYNSLKNAATQLKTSAIGLCVIEGVALLLLLVPKILEWAAIDAPAFDRGGAGLAAANLVLLLASFYLAFPCILSGVKALAKGRVTGGAAGGITFILALVQTVLSFFNKSPEGASGVFYCSAAVFALLMTAENGSRGSARVMQNFLFCTAKRKSGLYGIRAIESEKDAFEVGRSLKMGNPDILYSGKVKFPAEFIKNSEANSPADSCVKRSLIISSAVSVLLAVISGIITRDFFQAFGVLTGAFCLTSPCAIELALMIPLYLENRKLNSEGGMIAGYDAAVECSEAVAAAVDSADLFDRAACEMHGMKDFHTVRIDDVLLYAVAIVLKSGGPLTDVFNRIIGGSTELLPPVRDMIYEDRLGLSATIYNQRVLLGNRNLLTHHNIEVPLKSDEDKVKRNGRKILYIAIDSQVAAMFVFNYAEDVSLKESLNEMADNGFSLVVRTDDPNVTDELIAARFGIAQKDIKMTFSHGARIFSAYRDSVVDSAPAKVMHDGSARSYFKSIAACGRLANFASRWAVFALIMQAVVAAGAILCVALKAFAFVSPLTAVTVQCATVLFSVILEKFKK